MVCYILLVDGETVNVVHYRHQMINFNREQTQTVRKDMEKRFYYTITHESHQENFEKTKLECAISPPYSPDIAPWEYHLFRSMGRGLIEQHFANFEEVEK